MREWTASSVSLAWFIIPETRTVEFYRADGSHEIFTGIAQIAGDGAVEGFTLRLHRIWQGIVP